MGRCDAVKGASLFDLKHAWGHTETDPSPVAAGRGHAIKEARNSHHSVQVCEADEERCMIHCRCVEVTELASLHPQNTGRQRDVDKQAPQAASG